MSKFKGPDVEESVACNLIPMIDIMFLLLLFFMLSADMTQRELEEVKLPVADKAKQDDKAKENEVFSTVNVTHGEIACPANDPDNKVPGGCKDLDHWVTKVYGREYDNKNWGGLKEELNTLAHQVGEKEEGSGEGGKGYYSKRHISLRCDANTPFRHVQMVIQNCAEVGLYKIEVSAEKPALPGDPK
jgi:hypothetical protein